MAPVGSSANAAVANAAERMFLARIISGLRRRAGLTTWGVKVTGVRAWAQVRSLCAVSQFTATRRRIDRDMVAAAPAACLVVIFLLCACELEGRVRRACTSART